MSLGEPIEPEKAAHIQTHENHQFLVQLSPHVPGVETIFKKGKEAEEEVYLRYYPDQGTITALTAQQMERIENTVRKGREMAERYAAKEPMQSMQHPRQIRNTSDVLESVELAMAHCTSQRGANFTACLASNLIQDLEKHREENEKFSDMKSSMASRLRNYTCEDSTMQTSSPAFSYDVNLLDHNVILGPHPEITNLLFANGFSGHGFQLGPGVGDVMAELISTGSTRTAIEPFHIRRFATSSMQRSKAS